MPSCIEEFYHHYFLYFGESVVLCLAVPFLIPVAPACHMLAACNSFVHTNPWCSCNNACSGSCACNDIWSSTLDLWSQTKHADCRHAHQQHSTSISIRRVFDCRWGGQESTTRMKYTFTALMLFQSSLPSVFIAFCILVDIWSLSGQICPRLPY